MRNPVGTISILLTLQNLCLFRNGNITQSSALCGMSVCNEIKIVVFSIRTRRSNLCEFYKQITLIQAGKQKRLHLRCTCMLSTQLFQTCGV